MYRFIKNTAQIVGGAFVITCLMVGLLFLLGTYILGPTEPPQTPGTLNAETWHALTDREPLLGPADAPVKIVAFFDYQCPFCLKLHPLLEAVLAAFPEDVALIVRHFPLTSHPQAHAAALAAECARDQQHFAAYHTALFAHQDLVRAEAWQEIAQQAALPHLSRFASCVAQEAPAATVAHDLQQADALGLGGTPALVINGHMRVGMVSADQFKQLVRKAIAKAKS